MTCNQLMTLLAIYRGTLADEYKIGTRESDLAFLQREGFIKPAHNNGRNGDFACTVLAERWIRDDLLKGPK